MPKRKITKTANDDALSVFLSNRKPRTAQQPPEPPQQRITHEDDYAAIQRAQIEAINRHREQMQDRPPPAELVAWEAAQRAKGLDPDAIRLNSSSGRLAKDTTDPLEAQVNERKRQIKAQLSGHKLTMYGAGVYGCTCGQIHTQAGRHRASAERAQERHRQIITETIEGRYAGGLPECFYE